jgi:hypothetical protein
LTFTASSLIWVRPSTQTHIDLEQRAEGQASELISAFVARQVMSVAFKIDVTQVGLDEMREYPELGKPVSVWLRVLAHSLVLPLV